MITEWDLPLDGSRDLDSKILKLETNKPHGGSIGNRRIDYNIDTLAYDYYRILDCFCSSI